MLDCSVIFGFDLEVWCSCRLKILLLGQPYIFTGPMETLVFSIGRGPFTLKARGSGTCIDDITNIVFFSAGESFNAGIHTHTLGVPVYTSVYTGIHRWW